jgi:hypothetical protein
MAATLPDSLALPRSAAEAEVAVLDVRPLLALRKVLSDHLRRLVTQAAAVTAAADAKARAATAERDAVESKEAAVQVRGANDGR